MMKLRSKQELEKLCNEFVAIGFTFAGLLSHHTITDECCHLHDSYQPEQSAEAQVLYPYTLT
jgi:hypothetical protein